MKRPFHASRLTPRVLLFAIAASLGALLPPSFAAGTQLLHGHVPEAVGRLHLQPVGRLAATSQLRLAIGLPLRNGEALTNLMEEIYNPSSPNYHHYLTPEQFTEAFGPTAEDYQAVIAFAAANHLKVTKTPNRVLLDINASAADIERAFHVKLQVYKHPTEDRNFYAPDAEPSLGLTIPVLHIGGLDNYTRPHPKSHISSLSAAKNATVTKTGSGPMGGYMGKDFRAAYLPGTTLDGSGQKVGLFQADGYFLSDIHSYEAQAGLPNVPLTNVLLDGATGGVTDTNANSEVSLDIEMTISMAPGLSGIIVYEGSLTNYIPEDILNRMATDNAAKSLSCSWGWGGGPSTVIDQIFQQMVLQGQTFFDASGDVCAMTPLEVDDPTQPNQPSDNPYITQVGGVTLTTTGPGGPRVSETVWNWGFGEGSSGGFSGFYPIPVWQQRVSMANNGGSTTARNFPDVALVGDNVYVLYGGGLNGIFGGTSCAAPLWAGFTALVNQQAAAQGQPPVGFINPAIYTLCEGMNYAAYLNDVTSGNNTNALSPTEFFAVTGFDLCTGWGTPNGTNLINALVGGISQLGPQVDHAVVLNDSGILGPDQCNMLDIYLCNITTNYFSSVSAELYSTTPGIEIAQNTSTYPNFFAGATNVNNTAFKVSIVPSFVCGTPINFTMVVSSTQGVFTNYFSLSSGIASKIFAFTNSQPTIIPAVGGTNSFVTVTNITGAIDKVTVSLYAPYSFDMDLLIQLVGPDGTICTLSDGNGGAGQNYGLGCNSETTFDDGASSSITTGSAPFLGSFQPQQPLSIFNGKSGASVNGAWSLFVMDQFFGDVGLVNCWTLSITPAECPQGNGECPGADMALAMTGNPAAVVVGNNITYSIAVTNYGPSTATNVVVSQVLPSTVQFVSTKLSQGSYSLGANNILTFSLGNLAPGGVASITVVAMPFTSTPGVVYSTATVSSVDPDFNSSNNSATVSTVVNAPTADLALGLAVQPTSIILGNTVTYSLSVTNRGPSNASGVTVTNNLPAGANCLSVNLSQGSCIQSGNMLVFNFGALANSGVATASFTVAPSVTGILTDTASVSGSQIDPLPSNNSASVNVTVGPAADLGVSVVTWPNPVVIDNNLTYFITVTNRGPSPATGVTLSHTLDPSVIPGPIEVSQGTVSAVSNVVSADLGEILSGGSALVTVSGSPTVAGSLMAVSTVMAIEPDPNPTDNTITNSVVVAHPFVAFGAAGADLIYESGPVNGAIDNGETVTVNLLLRNIGNVINTNLVATLLYTNGVITTNGVIPTNGQIETQTYGILAPSGLPVARPFTFKASGASGPTISAVLQLKDGPNLMTNAVFTFTLPTSSTFANTNLITIRQANSAVPYPSTISVSGLTGTVCRVTATLVGFTHSYPQDANVLLVGPNGADVLLLSHAGTEPTTNVNLTFDDYAASPLPDTEQLYTGSWLCTAYLSAPIFSNPAPAGPFSSELSVFNSANPNGVWSLYVLDDSHGDSGYIANGWSLAVTTMTPVNQLADIGLTVTGPSSSIVPNNLTYVFTVTNAGPNTASFVTFTNVLPANVSYVSATTTSSHGSVGLTGSAVTGNLGALAAGATATVSVVVAPTKAAVGSLTNTASVAAPETDLDLRNNIASAVTTIGLPQADVALSQMVSTNEVVAGYTVTNLIVITNTGPGLALNVQFSDYFPASASIVSATSTLSVCSNSAGKVTCSLGNLATNTGAVIMLVLKPNVAGNLTCSASVTTDSADPNLTNNTSLITVTVLKPSASIVASGATLAAQSGSKNGALNPGECVTLSLGLRNVGTANTTNLTATLLSSGGVIPGTTQQTYGALGFGGATVSKSFAFAVSDACVGAVTVTLQLCDGAQNLGTVAFTFALPATGNFTNSSNIIIPDHGAGMPYPSIINVSGLSGVISKVDVTLCGLTHTFPSDINVLLVSPGGGNVLLMSHAGTNISLSGAVLTFDDAGVPLPFFSAITNGIYQPSRSGTITNFTIAPPYGSALGSLNGWNPNGPWTLFVYDDKKGDSGFISSGWSLNIQTVSPVNTNVADLAVSMIQAPEPVGLASNLTYSISVTNLGPCAASQVTLTDPLPGGLSFISGSPQGACTATNGLVTISLGSLNVGSATNASIKVKTLHGGLLTNTVGVAAFETDLNLVNNSAQTVSTVIGMAICQMGNGQFQGALTGAPGKTYIIQTSTNLVNWTPISTNTAAVYAPISFSINPQCQSRCFYRAVLAP